MDGRVGSPGVGLAFAGIALVLALLVAPAASAAKDPARTALNIIPAGQPGAVPPPAGADTQAKMYDGLTPLGRSTCTPATCSGAGRPRRRFPATC